VVSRICAKFHKRGIFCADDEFTCEGDNTVTERRSLKKYSIWAASLSLAALLAGCTTGNPNAAKGGDGTTGAGGGGNVLRYALTSEPTTLDPATVQDGTTIDLIQQVFEGLVRWSPNNEIEPNLAEKWDISPDGRVYTFHLKKGVKFHNGREMTAEDFKFSLERACDPELRSTTVPDYLRDIVGVKERLNRKGTDLPGVKVVDPHTLEITIDKSRPYWIGNMTYPCAYVVCKDALTGVKEMQDDKGVVGTGPFKMGTFQRGAKVSLTAFADYHGGKPKLDGIERPIIKDGSTRINSYESGALDIVDVSPRDLDRVNANAKLKPDLKAFKRAAIWYVALNQDAVDSPFKKREARLAFAHAIDAGDAIRLGMKDQADRANGIMPPGVFGYNPDVKPLAYDPSKAKQYLAQAGYPNGQGFPSLTLTYRNDYPHVEATSEVIAQQLKTNLGINVQLRPMEWAVFLRERTAKTMPLSHLRWAADYLDAQNFISTLFYTSRRLPNGEWDRPNNGNGYSNPEVDKLCDQADSSQDKALREKLYRQAEQIIIDDAAVVPIYFQRDLELVSPRVGDLRDSLMGHYPHIHTTLK
jgi:oligopeptide transport system substrate-binding protein